MPNIRITVTTLDGKILSEDVINALNYVKVTSPFFAIVAGDGPYRLDAVGQDMIVTQGAIPTPTEPMTIRARSEYLIAAMALRRAASKAEEELHRLGILVPYDPAIDGPKVAP